MEVNGAMFMADVVSKFWNSVLIKGWFYKIDDKLSCIGVIDKSFIASTFEANMPCPGVDNFALNCGFSIQILRSCETLNFGDVILSFKTESGEILNVDICELSQDRRQSFATPKLYSKFRDLLSGISSAKMIDIGGRARSKYDFSQQFPGVDVTVLDIIPGDNVTVVGDAHKVSTILPHDLFDAAFSVSVFEHLAMPWKAALEMNKILKMGGVAYIHTHQTIGMHDLPWDFFRFSSDSWDAIFNKLTGFEIIDRAMDDATYVIPFSYYPGKEKVEHSAGFEGSSVLIRKIANSKLSWDVNLDDMLDTKYPENDDITIILNRV